MIATLAGAAFFLGVVLGWFTTFIIMREPNVPRLTGRHARQPSYSPSGRGFWNDA